MAVTAGLLLAGPAQAVIFSPTQAELEAMQDVTTAFGGGGGLWELTLDGDGILLDMDFGPPAEGISRVVMQNQAFNADLTGFDSFDLMFTPQTFALGAKLFITTGEEGFFESPQTQIQVGSANRLSLPLDGIADLDDVTSFGIQMFDPDNGTSFAVLANVETAEEPKPRVTDTLFSFETGLEGWMDPDPTYYPNPETTREVVSANATEGNNALKVTRTSGVPNFRWGSEVRWDIDNGDTQEEINAIADRFNQADFLAFDITIDPADLDPATSFAGFRISLNDDSEAFYSSPTQFFDTSEPGTYTYEISMSSLIGANTSLPFESIVEDSEAIVLLLATNTDAPGSFYVDNFRLIREVDQIDYPGDANRDGMVDLLDLSILASNFDKPGSFGWEDGDFNDDGTVDLLDLSILAGNFDTSAPGVPEPAVASLILLGSAGLMRRRVA
ncbi:hypothetical protein [Mucisphaera calidilacus]|nr:hypothetical protein [Mucisphaera calidilacus]